MKEKNKNYKKDIMSAVLSSIVFCLMFIFFDILFTYVKLTDDTFPTMLYVFFLIFFTIPIVGIIINLIKRIKEIKGGEEYEARKY
ncbi:MAG: hypothetical protein E7163_05615 [Firmicutes bacterium]|nr:hypothetical protein [Bacillota bacterium]